MVLELDRQVRGVLNQYGASNQFSFTEVITHLKDRFSTVEPRISLDSLRVANFHLTSVLHFLDDTSRITPRARFDYKDPITETTQSISARTLQGWLNTAFFRDGAIIPILDTQRIGTMVTADWEQLPGIESEGKALVWRFPGNLAKHFPDDISKSQIHKRMNASDFQFLLRDQLLSLFAADRLLGELSIENTMVHRVHLKTPKKSPGYIPWVHAENRLIPVREWQNRYQPSVI